jgi:uncharacterized Zn-binding protein involved in type VI secretion
MAALAVLCALAPRAAAEDARRKQEIEFGEMPARTVDDAPFDINAKATSGLPVSFEVISGPAVLDGKKLTLTGRPGLVIVRASQAGNAQFQPAVPAERAFAVRPRPSAPEILAQPTATVVEIGELAVLTVGVAGEPAPAIQWLKDGIPVAGATDNKLTIASAALSDSGAYAAVASNASGTVTSERARVAVVKRHQTITFQGPPIATAGQPVALSASASSGLPVRFEVVSGSAVVNGAILTAQWPGTVSVQASQPGDATYDAAAPVTQSFPVNAPPAGQQPP